MTFDLEEDFENERWRLLALVDWRKNLSDESEGAIKTDLEIVATRELIRSIRDAKRILVRESTATGETKTGRYLQLGAVSPARDPEAPTPVPRNVEIDRSRLRSISIKTLVDVAISPQAQLWLRHLRGEPANLEVPTS